MTRNQTKNNFVLNKINLVSQSEYYSQVPSKKLITVN